MCVCLPVHYKATTDTVTRAIVCLLTWLTHSKLHKIILFTLLEVLLCLSQGNGVWVLFRVNKYCSIDSSQDRNDLTGICAELLMLVKAQKFLFLLWCVRPFCAMSAKEFTYRLHSHATAVLSVQEKTKLGKIMDFSEEALGTDLYLCHHGQQMFYTYNSFNYDKWFEFNFNVKLFWKKTGKQKIYNFKNIIQYNVTLHICIH